MNASMVIDENNNNKIQSCDKNHKIVVHRTDLKNIIELTEEDNDYQIKPQLDTKTQETEVVFEDTKQEKNCLQRYFTCICNILKFIWKKQNKWNYDINNNQYDKVIREIKRSRKRFQPVLPPQKEQKKVLVLDLDQTLVYSSFIQPESYDFEYTVSLNNQTSHMYTIKRFGLESFLFQMSKLYELIVFTASQKQYADIVINKIDPKGRISHRLYRQHCIKINKVHYLKNLAILGRNIKDVIIVDDNNLAGILQPENFYKIQTFSGNQKDRQLMRLADFLKYIHRKKRINCIPYLMQEFQSMEINLQQTSKEPQKHQQPQKQQRPLNKNKHKYLHKKTNSQVQFFAKSLEQQNQSETTGSQFIKNNMRC